MAKDLKFFAFDPAHPARNYRRLTVPFAMIGILVSCQSRRAFWELVQVAKRSPLQWESLDEGRHDVPDQWNCDHGAGQNVESEAKLEKKVAATEIAIPFPPAGLAVSLGSCVLIEVLSFYL